MSDTKIGQEAVVFNAARMPLVSERDGRVFADSRDVATFFGKRHDDVLKAVRNLVGQRPDLGLRNFADTPYVDAQNGQTYRSFEIDRTGFSLLAMGFTGAKALDFKLRYIEQFDAMESALKNPLAGFAIPQTMAEALRLAADQSEKLAEQQRRIDVMAPKVEGFDRIANSDGHFNLQLAAKLLGQPPKRFIARLHSDGWIYKRDPSSSWIGYQDKVKAGYVDHKTHTFTRPDGTEKSNASAVITSKGLTVLARKFGAAVAPSMVN